jgi:hypothetical protein
MRAPAAALFIVLATAARPAAAALVEGILELHAEATVGDDGGVTVDETILVYSAGGLIRHGIDRELVTRYRDRSGNPHAIELQLLRITRDGQPEPHRLEATADGLRIRLGEPGVVLATGTHVYVLSYRTRRQLGFYQDRDELYWNVTGDRWPLRIEQASAVVRLPEPAARAIRSVVGFAGPPGSTDRSVLADRRGTAAVFTTRRPLAPGEGLAVAVTWPPGLVRAPTWVDDLSHAVGDRRFALAALLPLVLQGLCLLLAFGVVGGRARGPAPAPRPTPPEGLSPAAVRFVTTGAADAATLAAALLSLARQGAVTVAARDDGTFVLARAGAATDDAALAPEERAAAQALFRGGDQVQVAPGGAASLAAAGNALGAT